MGLVLVNISSIIPKKMPCKKCIETPGGHTNNYVKMTETLAHGIK